MTIRPLLPLPIAAVVIAEILNQSQRRDPAGQPPDRHPAKILAGFCRAV
jgi:hypothetical protein